MSNYSENLATILAGAAELYRSHNSAISQILVEELTLATSLVPSVAEPGLDPPPALGFLEAALDGDDWVTPEVRDALRSVALDLRWQARLSDVIGHGFDAKYAACVLVGSEGLITSSRCRCGLFIMVPDVFYPSHHHAAEELYVILSGTADWQKDEAAFAPLPPGGFTHHSPWQPHATRSSNQPLLAFWGWAGDVDPGKYKMV